MLQPNSEQKCPNCQLHNLAPSAVGLMCPGCGHIQHNQTVDEDSQPLIHNPDYKPLKPPAVQPQDLPTIINHHRSSHYQKRLDQRLNELAVAELPAPEPEILLEEKTRPLEIVAPPPLQSSNAQPSRLPEQTPAAPTPTKPVINPDRATAQADLLLSTAQSSQTKGSQSRPIRIWAMGAASLGLIIFSGFILTQSLTQGRTTPSATPTPTLSPTPAQAAESSQRDAQRKTDLNLIAVGLEAYKKSQGAYPVGDTITVLYSLQKTSPPYIEAIPNDPLTRDSTTAALRYGYTSDGTSFTLTAILENKQDADLKDGLYSVKNTR